MYKSWNKKFLNWIMTTHLSNQYLKSLHFYGFISSKPGWSQYYSPSSVLNIFPLSEKSSKTLNKICTNRSLLEDIGKQTRQQNFANKRKIWKGLYICWYICIFYFYPNYRPAPKPPMETRIVEEKVLQPVNVQGVPKMVRFFHLQHRTIWGNL